MPEIEINGVRLHYVEQGTGPEVVVFSHSYLLDWSHFKPQMHALSERYRCIAFDHRGHGGSEKPKDGYDMETLYADAVAFIEAMDSAPVHFVGLSTGGFIGLRLGFRRPDLLRTLTLMDTSAEVEPALKKFQYKMMLAMVGVIGTRPFAGYIMSLFFSKSSPSDPSRQTELARFRKLMVENDKHAIIRFGHGIFDRTGVLDSVGQITVPTLVIAGEQDTSQPPARAQQITDRIPNSKLLIVPNAAHISNVDDPATVNAALEKHLARHE
ncbi:MAG: alpha/beta fold hydrolase [Acidimicrobiales bacterium]|nr:alpha/beta fold hydrolase [Acidimicrobiales bacterium]